MYNYDGLRGSTELAIEIDSNTLKVLKFINRNIPCNKMVAVSELVAKMAPILWGHYDREEIYPCSVYYEEYITETTKINRIKREIEKLEKEFDPEMEEIKKLRCKILDLETKYKIKQRKGEKKEIEKKLKSINNDLNDLESISTDN